MNRGLIYRLNESINMARGKFYARMDADDIMHPDRIKKQVECLSRNVRVDVVGTAWYSIDCNNRVFCYNEPNEFPTPRYILTNICFYILLLWDI